MEKLFKEIMDIYEVHGLVLLSSEGKVLYQTFKRNRTTGDYDVFNWIYLAESLGNFREANLVFEKGRFYIRRIETGYLMVSMKENVSMPIIKLNCDTIIPQLSQIKAKKGLFGFFKR